MTRRLITDAVFLGILCVLAGLLLVPLGLIFYYIVSKGMTVLSWQFLTSMPVSAGEPGGGILNAIVGTLMSVFNASLVAIPIGITVGIYLYEYQTGILSAVVRFCVEILQGVPSIVIGIVVYLWCVVPFGHFSSWAGSLALAMMMLPVMIRNTEETLKLIPQSLKEASLALGVSYPKTILKVILPTGMRGIVSGAMLAISRVSGETAPLLFTAFGNPFLSFDPSKPIQTIPLLVFNYATSPYPDWQAMAWGASLVLVGFVLMLNLATQWIAKKRF